MKKNQKIPQAVLSFLGLFTTTCLFCSENATTAFQEFIHDGTFTFHSTINGEVQVMQKNGIRWLIFKKGDQLSTQSKIDLQDPALLLFEYTKCSLLGFALFKEPHLQVHKVLMIGLGAGSLLRFTQKHFPAAYIDTVEIDPLIVDLSRKYFFVTPSDLVKIHVGDGRAFVETAAQSYDMVILDAFNADNQVPRELTSVEFLKTLKSRMNVGGVVVTNFINNDEKVYASILATYLQSFRHVHRCELKHFQKSNVVIFATDDPKKNFAGNELIKRVNAFSMNLNEAYDLAKYAEVYEAVVNTGTSSPVIHD